MSSYNSNSFTNPTISKVTNFDDAFGGAHVATYKGILSKTLYFLALILLGMGAFIYIHNYFAAEYYTATEISNNYVIYNNELGIFSVITIATFICGLIASFVPRSIPVTGSIYCAGMGYAITFISYTYMAIYKGIIIEALLITILIIAVMAGLYASKLVKIGQRFKTVVFSALLASVIGGFIFSIMYWIAPNSAIVTSIIKVQSGPIGIFFAVLGVLIGAALLLWDFETIAQTVENGLSKKYEWFCSYGLMVSIIYLYLKVLRLLARILSRDR